MKTVFALLMFVSVSHATTSNALPSYLSEGYESLKIKAELVKNGFSATTTCSSRMGGPVADLSQSEAFALCFYSEQGLTAMNQDLASKKGKGFKAIIKAVDSAIEKLPKISGTFERGAELSDEEIKDLKVGTKLKYRTFTGLSKKYPWFRPVIFKITTKDARDVSYYAAEKSKIDILIKRDAKFEVKDVKTSDGMTEVSLEQL